jgi:hypothetical protein
MNIIRPDIYEDTTLRQTAEKLSDKNIEITDDLLINLVTKYFYAFFYPGAADRRVPLQEIEELFTKCGLYFLMSFEASKLHKDLDYLSLDYEGQIAAKNNYVIGML